MLELIDQPIEAGGIEARAQPPARAPGSILVSPGALVRATITSMASITAELPTICAACRSSGAITVTQALVDKNLTWSESFACECGHGFEAKNVGLPTPAARQALMVAHGRHTLVIDAIPEGSRAWKVLGRLLDATEDEVAQRLGALPATLWEGTSAEAEFMRRALANTDARLHVDVAPPLPSTKRKRK